MRKRELQEHLDSTRAELEAANAELQRLRVAQAGLADERAALQSQLDTERFVQRTLPSPAAHAQVVESVPERRIVHLQATVIDERAQEVAGGPLSAEEEAWHRSIRDRLMRGCRDAENLLSVAEPTPIVRAARYALAFALRDTQLIEGDAPRELEAGEGGVGESVGLPAGDPAPSLDSDASG